MNPAGQVVKQLYALWGLPLTLELQRALSESKKEHESYTQVHKYRNPTLEELGLSLDEVERRYDAYIRTVHVGVSHNPKGACLLKRVAMGCLPCPALLALPACLVAAARLFHH